MRSQGKPLASKLERQADTTYWSRDLLGKQCWGRSSWPVTDELLEALCGRVWELKTPGEPLIVWPPLGREFYLLELCQVLREMWEKMGEKSPPVSRRGREKGTILNIPEHSSSSQGLTSRETISPEANLLGFCENLINLGEGKCPNAAPASHPVPPKQGKTEKHL